MFPPKHKKMDWTSKCLFWIDQFEFHEAQLEGFVFHSQISCDTL